MVSLRVRSARVRRISHFVALTVGCLAMTAMTAQQAAAQDPAAPQPAPPPDALKLNAEAAVLLNLIKPDKTADFEGTWKDIKAKLAASDKPDLKAFGENLKIYKLDAPPNAQTGVTYLFICDPASKTQSYSPTELLFKSGVWTREEADALFAKLKDCYNQIVPWPLVRIG
jgi:hypothetical protein